MEAGHTIAGKYRLNRLLGTGGMATVWSATNVFTEREFAVKFMLPQVARTPEAARRFLTQSVISPPPIGALRKRQFQSLAGREHSRTIR